MLTFCHGSELAELAGHLVSELNENPPEHPLAPEVFVVQNYGMGRWLSMYMAEKEGIAANLTFEFPAERMWTLYRLIDPDIPKTLPSDRLPMAFSILQLLDNLDGGEELFQPLLKYIHDAPDDTHRLRAWKLSNRIADIFDQYLVYRPELLLKWEADERETSEPSERWQAALWCKLKEKWEADPDQNNLGWSNRADLQRELVNYIDENRFEMESLPERITVFGVSTLPPAFIKTFVRLSKLIDVRFYWLAPVSDDLPDHPLLESMGKEGYEFLSIFREQVKKDRKVSESYREINLTREPDVTGSLLEELRYDIIRNRKKDHSEKRKSDRTIQLHSCHSSLREVEVLRDQLLALFDEDKDLAPEDVVIMTPDIETYAPLIDAVFGTTEEGIPDIPFSIADRGFRSKSSVAETYMKILDLLQSRFKVTDVMELLESKPLRNRLNLTDDDMNLLQQWIHDIRIRWGIDGRFRKEQGLPGNNHFTWDKGISRILFGYAMQSDGDNVYSGCVPYSKIEGMGQAELAGKISRTLNRLFGFYEQTNQINQLTYWHRLCSKILEEFFPDTDEYHHEISQIRRQLNKLTEFAEVSRNSMPVSFGIVRSFIGDLLENHQTGGGFLGQGITFCALVPMRSIPFKVIGLMGMNEGAFPRHRQPAEFDLMRLNPKPGDRSRADDDRYLFLETLLSAEKNLLISYVGQSNVQDTHFPPSVVVSELISVIEEEYGVSGKDITTEHRLQAFSPRYFTRSNHKLYSYAESQLQISRKIISEVEEESAFITDPLPDAGEEGRTVGLGDFISFFQHPVRYFMQQRLGLYLQNTDVLTEEREPFQQDGLTAYHLKKEMLERYLRGEDPESYKTTAMGSDLLPVGYPGQRSFRVLEEEVEDFGNELREILDQSAVSDLEIDLNLDPFHLTGEVDSLYQNGQWLYRFGSLRSKDRVELWIRHLVFLTAKPDYLTAQSCMLTKSASDAVTKEILIPVEQPHELLKNLLKLYKEGLEQPMMFFPETSYHFACKIINEEKQVGAAARSAFYTGWLNGHTPVPLEGQDAYNRLFVRDNDPTAASSFRDLAVQFWQPYLESVKAGT